MAFNQFPNDIIVKDLDTAEVIEMCSFTDSGALRYIRSFLLLEQLQGSEQLQLELRETDGVTVRASSNIITLSEITTDSYWLGWIRFDFDTKPNLGTNLRLFLTPSNYSYVSGTRNISIVRTYLNPTYPTSETSMLKLPADIQIFKEQVLT